MIVKPKRPGSRRARKCAATFPLVLNEADALAQFLDEVRAELLQKPRIVCTVDEIVKRRDITTADDLVRWKRFR